ncbi:Zn-ribbon domain-containing OB-fold protein [Actinocorallia aurantiaca]|uniref:Zinc ribbon domain-containing protein n=1 Tax=Actinocorallia aurantiaca TaxID=46204 RepID=A0ABN3UHZ7_9ACTN
MLKERRLAIEGWFTTDPVALIGTRCGECGTPYFPKNTLACRNPGCAGPKDGSELEEYTFSTRGRVWSYADSRYKPPPPYISPEPFRPYVLAAVELDVEKIVILGQVVPGVTVDDLAVGQEVELTLGTLYEDDEAEYAVWMWRPVS